MKNKLFLNFFFCITVLTPIYSQTFNRRFLVENKIYEVKAFGTDSAGNKCLKRIYFISDSGLVIKSIQYSCQEKNDTSSISTFEYDSLNRPSRDITYLGSRSISSTYNFVDKNTTRTLVNNDGKTYELVNKYKFSKHKKITKTYSEGQLTRVTISKKRGNKWIVTRHKKGRKTGLTLAYKEIQYMDSNHNIVKCISYFPSRENCKKDISISYYTFDSNNAETKQCHEYSKCVSNTDYCETIEYLKK